ncbi:MAG TPA: type IV pilus twitching motility protein PilT [Acidobacteriota bacterium]|jgi:twitching motility protein PilT
MEDNLDLLLKRAVELNASDVHLSVGVPCQYRIHGDIIAQNGGQALTAQDTAKFAAKILLKSRKATPENVRDVITQMSDEDLSYSITGLGRFRVNICCQRGTLSLVLRNIPNRIPGFEELNLPPVLAEIAMEERGLILVTGITGSGKSTTLAAMVDYINKLKGGKIITIEDPIEFLHENKKASVVQREVGIDTESFARAMRASLRQDPDVILVGEMRDRETIETALRAGETGHLVLSTLHTTDTAKTIQRIVSYFDLSEQKLMRLRLSESMKAIISQRLLTRLDIPGRIVAIEIMRNTLAVRDCIENPEKTDAIYEFMKTGKDPYGMQTFDQHLMELYKAGNISLDEAKRNATSPDDFERNLKFI